MKYNVGIVIYIYVVFCFCFVFVFVFFCFCFCFCLVIKINNKGGFILRVRQRYDEQYNCCDGEAILLRNHCFFVASLLSFLVRVA
jgi:hypothetical protein